MKHKALYEPKPLKAFRDKYLAAVMMVAALFITSIASAQADSLKYSKINGYGFVYKRWGADSVLMVPLSTSPHTPYRSGGIRYHPTDSTLQLWTGSQWRSIVTGGTGIDTAYMFNDTLLTIETPNEDFFLQVGKRHVDSIYRKNGQDSIFFKIAGIERAIKDSSGTNLTLNNVGTGYNILATPSGNIKRLNNGYGILIDSATSNTNTVAADTSSTNHLVTQSDLNDGLAPKLNASDTANKWLNDIRRRPGTDTVEKFKNGNWQFAYIDSTGGSGTVQTEYSVTGDGSSGDKIKLVNDASTPGSNKVYGTNTSGTKGYQSAAVLNLTSPANGQILIYQGGEWVNTDYTPYIPESQITFRVAIDPVLSAGDSVYQDDALIGKMVKVYREGERMYVDTVYGVESDSSTGTIVFHPYLSSAEKIIIEVVSFTTTNPGTTLEDLTFPTAVSLTNTGTTWSATSSVSFYDGYGLSNKKLASGEDGYIRAKYTTTDGSAAIIAFNTSNTNEKYADNPASPSVYNYEAGAFLASGTLYYLDNNTAAASTGHTLSVGDYWRIIRTGSTLKLQTSPDASTWTDRHTYAFSSAADLFINCNIDANTGANKLYEPKGFNVE